MAAMLVYSLATPTKPLELYLGIGIRLEWTTFRIPINPPIRRGLAGYSKGVQRWV
jgi:hypothetical protein